MSVVYFTLTHLVQVNRSGGYLDSCLFAEIHPTIIPSTRRCQDSVENSGRERQGHRDAEGATTGKQPRICKRPGCRPRAEKGGAYRHGNGGRGKHAAQGRTAEAFGWRVITTPRWVALCTGEERAKQEGFDNERLRIGKR